MKLLLDSHTLLWALYEPQKLPPRVVSAIADLTNVIYVSHVSVLELTDKAAKFRLAVAGSLVDRIVDRIVGLGVTLVPIALTDVTESVKLPLTPFRTN